ncbi:hypothetical protein [Pararhodobacter zhoushanensis]|uniref:Elongation factor P n=1 Tax=Pararhodobacter zhoushanensis TaxID=2479545 RepID=A0ABT3H1W8_9RHOB|nr:hypothetical protein [Pararhodobacter zhoushanensis]MCW1933730.1 hypothetical protein [Pararhodobacter zhoushanensis]
MRRILSPLIAAMMLLAPVAAHADSIDGTWCEPGGPRSLQIDGASFITPGGHSVTGVYRRHDGGYTVPEGEAGAGEIVVVMLLGEESLRVAEPGANPVIWGRCNLSS